MSSSDKKAPSGAADATPATGEQGDRAGQGTPAVGAISAVVAGPAARSEPSEAGDGCARAELPTGGRVQDRAESPSNAATPRATPAVQGAESPRIQALIDREVAFPAPSPKCSPEDRWRLWRIERFKLQPRRRSPKSLLALIPKQLRAFWHGLRPPGLFVASFALLIACGTAGLCLLPGLQATPLSFIDALFTMTSAVSVTGLSVIDISARLTFFGQLWVLLFIQLGGLGLFTFSTFIICALGRKLSLRGELLTTSLIETHEGIKTESLARDLVRFSLSVEGICALILWPQLIESLTLKGVAEGLWHAVFLSISAFCNAGFAPYPDSLMGFAERPLVLLPLTFLVITGGLGFLVIGELRRWWKGKGLARRNQRLSLHTLTVVTVTLVLLLGGFALFLAFEWSGALAGLGIVDKLTDAWVLSVMTRTAGFNSVDTGVLSNASVYLTILLMFIGGSPGSTASGIKTTTFAVLAAQAFSRIRGQRYVSLFRRTVPDLIVQRAGAIALIAFGLISLAVFFLGWGEAAQAVTIAAERRNFLPILFESVSALSTVGLSLNFTPLIGEASKLILIALMFIGRVGLLAFFSAISLRERPRQIQCRPAIENVFLG